MGRRKTREREQITVRVIKRKNRQCYVLRWKEPATNRMREQATEIEATRPKRRLAEREAADLQQELRDQQASAGEFGWVAFNLRYTREHLSGLKQKSRNLWNTARKHLEEIGRPVVLASVDAQMLSLVAATLRSKGIRETSIASYMRTLLAGLGWAKVMGMIDDVPQYLAPKRARGITKAMRSRAITLEEYERLQAMAKTVRPTDFARWRRLLRGLWWGGLRISEALALTWEPSPFAVDLSGKYPVFRIWAEGEKAHQDRILPMAPELAEILLRVPERARRGKVFGIDLTPAAAGKIISDIGRKAGIRVAENKCATAHDLRRSFGTRWASRVQPIDLMKLMRHANIETTLKYYVSMQAQDLSSRLWKTRCQNGDISSDNDFEAASNKASQVDAS